MTNKGENMGKKDSWKSKIASSGRETVPQREIPGSEDGGRPELEKDTEESDQSPIVTEELPDGSTISTSMRDGSVVIRTPYQANRLVRSILEPRTHRRK